MLIFWRGAKFTFFVLCSAMCACADFRPSRTVRRCEVLWHGQRRHDLPYCLFRFFTRSRTAPKRATAAAPWLTPAAHIERETATNSAKARPAVPPLAAAACRSRCRCGRRVVDLAVSTPIGGAARRAGGRPDRGGHSQAGAGRGHARPQKKEFKGAPSKSVAASGSAGRSQEL